MPLDLDAARVARQEARGEPPSVILGGREYKLQPELSIEAGAAWRPALEADDSRMWLRHVLLDPSEADDFAATPNLSWADINELFSVWRVTQGEASASPLSSVNGGTRSRPTSKRTTTSI